MSEGCWGALTGGTEGVSISEDRVRVSLELDVFGERHSSESLWGEDTRVADLDIISSSTEFPETAGMSKLLDREEEERAGARSPSELHLTKSFSITLPYNFSPI